MVSRRVVVVGVLIALFLVCEGLDGIFKEERDRGETTSATKDPWRSQKNGMPTNGDYAKLLGPESDGQIVKPSEPKNVPVEVPSIQLSDILPSTGFVVIRDMLTQTVLANSTGFLVSPNVILTAAHTVAPFIRRFHVQLEFISNSRSRDSIRTYPITGLAYDYDTTPCQIFLMVRESALNIFLLLAPDHFKLFLVKSNLPYHF